MRRLVAAVAALVARRGLRLVLKVYVVMDGRLWPKSFKGTQDEAMEHFLAALVIDREGRWQRGET